MSRGPATFRQADVTRAIRAAEAAGKHVARIEIECGKIVVVTATADANSATTLTNGARNPWDDAIVEMSKKP